MHSWGIASVVITTSGRGNCKELDLVTTENASTADAEQRENGKNKGINEWQSDKHPTCHSV